MRRLVAAAESEVIGYGGISAVARATGVSRRAITEGMKELRQPKVSRESVPAQSRIGRKGAGRKRTVDKDPALREDLDRLVDPTTRGDPESPLRWTCKSVRTLAEDLRREGHAVSYQTVAELLHEMDYSLQANQKTLEGSRHADRNPQFEYINRKAQRYLKQGEPVISVDTKKKELVGDFKNSGREWQPQGEPEQVRVHDFEIRQPDKGKVAPYGVYDLGRNVGWVSVGVDHDTAEFAVESIRRWWRWIRQNVLLRLNAVEAQRLLKHRRRAAVVKHAAADTDYRSIILAGSVGRRKAGRKIAVAGHARLKLLTHAGKEAQSSNLAFVLREPGVVVLVECEQRVACRDGEQSRLPGFVSRERGESICTAEVIGVVGVEGVEVCADAQLPRTRAFRITQRVESVRSWLPAPFVDLRPSVGEGPLNDDLRLIVHRAQALVIGPEGDAKAIEEFR